MGIMIVFTLSHANIGSNIKSCLETWFHLKPNLNTTGVGESTWTKTPNPVNFPPKFTLLWNLPTCVWLKQQNHNQRCQETETEYFPSSFSERQLFYCYPYCCCCFLCLLLVRDLFKFSLDLTTKHSNKMGIHEK